MSPILRSRLFRALPLLAIAWLGLGRALTAQPAGPAVQTGGWIAYEFGVPLAASRFPGQINRYGVAGNGESYCHIGAVGLEVRWPGFPATGSTALARLAGAFSIGRFLSDPFEQEGVIDPTTLLPIVRQFQLDYSIGMVRLDLPILWKLAGGWSVGAGLWGTARFSSGFSLTERITAPDSATYPDGTRERTLEIGGSLGAAWFRGGGLLVTSIEFPVGSRLSLAPELLARVDAGAVADGLGLRSLSAGLGLTVLVRLGDDVAAAPDSMRPPPVLDVALHLRAGDSASIARLVPQRTLYRSVTVLPPVLFEHGDAAIAGVYRRAAPLDRNAFAEASLARRSPASVGVAVLDIVGRRLRDDASAALAITGTADADEPAGLAIRRAESVRDYLHTMWGIGLERLSARAATTGDPVPASRSASMGSNRPATLAPVETEWMVQRWRAPQLSLGHSIRSAAGVRRWELLLRQGGRVLSTTSGSGEDIPATLESAMQIGADTVAPLVAEFTVIDMAGQGRTVFDTLRLLREMPLTPPRPSREVFACTIADSGAAGPGPGGPASGVSRIPANAEGLLGELARDVRAGASVAVEPVGSAGSDSAAHAGTALRVLAWLLARPELRGLASISLHPSEDAAALPAEPGPVDDAGRPFDPYAGAGVTVRVEQPAAGD